MLMSQLLHIRLCRILTKSPQNIANLRHLNSAVSFLVEKLESLLEIYQQYKINSSYTNLEDGKQETNTWDSIPLHNHIRT